MIRRPALAPLIDALGIETFTVVDVGARGGVHDRWRAVGEALRSVEFEPGQAAGASSSRRTVLPVGISNRRGQATFHVTRSLENCSCQPPFGDFLSGFPHPERFDVLQRVSIPVDTLDRALEDARVVSPDFLKIDVQGHELAVLDGAPATLGRVAGVEVETAFHPMYEGQPMFADVDARLRGAGLRFVDLRPGYWKREATPQRGRGELVFADALYLAEARGTARVPRVIAVAAAYRKFDLALALSRALPPGAARRVEAAIRRVARPGWLPRHFRYAGRLALLLDKASDELKSRNWARFDAWT